MASLDSQLSTQIRPEKLADKVDVHHVIKAAFGQESEADLVERLRNRGMLVISLVASLFT